MSVEILQARDLPSFLPPVIYPGGGIPSDIAVGDLNGDGRPDVATADGDKDTVAVRFGNGDGTLQPPVTYATGEYPYGVRSADFNGDGRPDLVTANAGSQSVSVLLNNGNGIFGPAHDYGGLNDYPYRVAVGDVDGDHIPDVAVSDYNGPYLWVLHGNGDGTLAPPRVITVPEYCQGVQIADVDHDGVGDITVDTFTAGIAVVYSSTGAVVTYPAPGPWGHAVADLNGDGWPDLVVGRVAPLSLYVLLNRGDGTFGPPTGIYAGTGTQFPAVADVNRDGKPDIVLAGTVLVGNGDGTFVPPLHFVGSGGAVATGDLNHDRYPDLVESSSVGVAVLLNDGNWHTPVPPPGAGTPPAAGAPAPQPTSRLDRASAVAAAQGGAAAAPTTEEGPFAPSSAAATAQCRLIRVGPSADLSLDGLPGALLRDGLLA
jgi:hypothetical protein